MTASEGAEGAEYMTMGQAVAWFGCAQTTVQDWYDRGCLDGFRTGNPTEKDEHGRYGTKGARRIVKDEAAIALRRIHKERKEAAAALAAQRRPQAT